MLHQGMTKKEIKDELITKGIFIQIDYLSNFLEQNLSRDMKVFCYLQLSEIYEKMKLFNESAKMNDKIAIFSISFSEKIKYHTKEAEMYIQAGDFISADEAIKKASVNANSVEKNNIYLSIKEFYKNKAQGYEREVKRNHAVKIYEKLLRMNISEVEKRDITKKLNELYERLGKPKVFLGEEKGENYWVE